MKEIVDRLKEKRKIDKEDIVIGWQVTMTSGIVTID